uniref:Iron complex transport system substrate-binding protein n=1 Tax=Candidatus Kentrum sp. FW TaxID=2126338 RepID=A0A450SNT5_9GAMM|nr:MAG: hypothetical protein BECKFW1821B_GA0114236_10239 [Candidatus Kentron sp. FW]VFJ76125.1 MAG: hypothetical protein BECKFW1821C_GA0114237_109912 [Candidatus Kentron sp. FW]
MKSPARSRPAHGWITLRLALCLTACPWAGRAVADTAPQRIVSLNTCTDQLLLMLARPDWLITSDYKRDAPTLGSRSLRHPVLRALPGGEFILPGNLTACGGPWNARAVALLAGLPAVD